MIYMFPIHKLLLVADRSHHVPSLESPADTKGAEPRSCPISKLCGLATNQWIRFVGKSLTGNHGFLASKK